MRNLHQIIVDYYAQNSLLPLVVEAQGILSLVPLHMIAELYVMLNGSTAIPQ